MEWFYAANGKQAGPVTESQLADLARAGAITPETLVWRTGMEKWEPFKTVAIGASAVASGEQALCIECGRSIAKSEMVAYDKAFVCAACKPIFFQKLKEGVTPGAGQMWRTRNDLVLAKEAAFPDRCVKCNAPAHGSRLKRDLYWHQPWIYILVLVSILIYVIVAVIVRKRAIVHIALCDAHRNQRRWAIAIGWGLFFAGIGAIVAAVSYGSGWTGVAAAAMILGGAIYGLVRGRMVYAARIDAKHVWLRGVCPAFLDTLPEWTGRN